MRFLREHTTARARKGSVVVGMLLAFAIVVGSEVYRSNSIAGLASSPAHALSQVVLAVVVTIAGAALALLLFAARNRLAARNVKAMPAWFASRQAFAAGAIVLFCLWLPCLAAYWPGLFSYDIPTQTDFIASGSWTTQQPPLHTLIWALFLNLEGMLGLKAITWYAIAQMAFLAVSFSAVLRFIAARGAHRALWALALLFFGLNPVIAIFSIVPVKDALLAGVLSLLSIEIAQLVGDPSAFTKSAPHCVGFAACIVACCLLRANMLVAVVVFSVVAIALFKGERKRMIALCAVPLALTAVVIGPVYSIAGISPGSSAIASVPFQQVVNVVRTHGDELADEEIAVVEAVIPVDKAIERYNPRFADTVVRLFKGKEHGAASLRGELADFAGLWISLIGRYPVECLDAFLSLNIAYWYPFAETPDPYSKRSYIETFVWKDTPHYAYEAASLWPELQGAYERVADYSALDNPLAGIVFSPSSVIWILIGCAYLLYCSDSRRNALVVVLPVLFWLSFMIGPVSNMRYVFPLFCLYPLLVSAALQPEAMLAGSGRS